MSPTAFISTTIPYVNAKPHLGHALEYVQTDSFARHLSRAGKDVYFLSGSDENSLKNVLAAEREGIPVRELVDRNAVHFEELLERLHVEPKYFIRTSVDAKHTAGAIDIWRCMATRGDVYTKDYTGLYCVGCEQFYSPVELLDGVCPEHGTVPELVQERNYFFRLSRYSDQLLEELRSGRVRVIPGSRMNEVTSFVQAGLEDISISRSMQRARGWGIAVPEDDTQVMYVWIDALTNYINALDWMNDSTDYKRYWSESDQRIHVVGKGVLRFHAVYWPAMLMSAGLPLPTEVVVHGYITASGQKLSKSSGNMVDPVDLVERYGLDAVRYFLLGDISPFGDGDFSEERMIARYNGDLANGLGNLISRLTSMMLRYRDGVVPQQGESGEHERALAEQVRASVADSVAAMDRYDHREALQHVWTLVRRANAYVDERAPWHLAKAAATGDEQSAALLDTTLHHLVGAARQLGWLLWPFLPSAAETILKVFGETVDSVPAPEAWLNGLTGRKVTKPPAVFPRLEPQG